MALYSARIGSFEIRSASSMSLIAAMKKTQLKHSANQNSQERWLQFDSGWLLVLGSLFQLRHSCRVKDQKIGKQMTQEHLSYAALVWFVGLRFIIHWALWGMSNEKIVWSRAACVSALTVFNAFEYKYEHSQGTIRAHMCSLTCIYARAYMFTAMYTCRYSKHEIGSYNCFYTSLLI